MIEFVPPPRVRHLISYKVLLHATRNDGIKVRLFIDRLEPYGELYNDVYPTDVKCTIITLNLTSRPFINIII